MSEKMREEFELWLSDSGQLSMREDDGEYSFQHTRFAWESWKASRAALVVELPQKPYCAQGMAYPDYSDALNDCREAIESVGVKCK